MCGYLQITGDDKNRVEDRKEEAIVHVHHQTHYEDQNVQSVFRGSKNSDQTRQQFRCTRLAPENLTYTLSQEMAILQEMPRMSHKLNVLCFLTLCVYRAFKPKLYVRIEMARSTAQQTQKTESLMLILELRSPSRAMVQNSPSCAMMKTLFMRTQTIRQSSQSMLIPSNNVTILRLSMQLCRAQPGLKAKLKFLTTNLTSFQMTFSIYAVF